MQHDKDSKGISRRQFGKIAGAAAAGAMLPGYAVRALAAETADQIIPGKSAMMHIHNAKLGVMETPLTLLRPYEALKIVNLARVAFDVPVVVVFFVSAVLRNRLRR